METKFYVYVYLNPLKCGKFKFKKFEFDYEPFYVGKGHGDRYLFHLYTKLNNNRHKSNTINKIHKNNKEPIIMKLYENITEYSAFRLEKTIIKIIGRNDLNLGTLTNMTDGGEGSYGQIFTRERRINMIKIKGKIIQYDNYGIIKKIWDNIVDISIEYPNYSTRNIHRSCESNGGRKVGGYFWKYHDNEIETNKIEVIDKHKPILQYDLDGVFIKKWNYSGEISNSEGIHSGAVLKCCRNYIKNGLYYKYKKSMWFFDDGEIQKSIIPYTMKMAKGDSLRNKKEIDMYDLNGNFIKTTNPINLKNEHFLLKTIYRCCNDTLKSSQGYIWKWHL